jgi:hypothetical protein
MPKAQREHDADDYRGRRSMVALEEGPFTRLDGVPLTVSLEVPFERLTPGPTGGRFATWVRPDDSARAPASGARVDPWDYRNRPCPGDLEELLGDRLFLGQHAYAVAASTLELFEATLGRRLPWRSRGHRLMLRLFEPIPFEETGYVGQRGEIRFGHVRDGRARRHVPLALYRDLVAHEVTHAIIDGYRPHFSDPDATLDEHALHEGVADAVAMLSVFSSTSRVAQQIDASTVAHGGSAESDDTLLASGLFGVADGLYSRQALRRSVTGSTPADWRAEREPHHRGEVLVRALMDTVMAMWQARMSQPGGRSSSYQIAEAGARSGRQVLRMLIRGIGYMPPVDATFEDLVRGVLAADMAVIPDDDADYRGVLRSAFARQGIRVVSDDRLDGLTGFDDLRYPIRLSSLGSDPEEVYRFLWENPTLLRALAIDPDAPVVVERVRPSQRVGLDGFVVTEISASFTQIVSLTQREARQRLGLRAPGPVLLRGGGLLRFDEGGRLCFVALKPVLDRERQQARLDESAGPTTVDQSAATVEQRRAAVFTHLHSAGP